jgi:hypothetical protein
VPSVYWEGRPNEILIPGAVAVAETEPVVESLPGGLGVTEPPEDVETAGAQMTPMPWRESSATTTTRY